MLSFILVMWHFLGMVSLMKLHFMKTKGALGNGERGGFCQVPQLFSFTIIIITDNKR